MPEILFADDDDSMRLMVAAALGAGGYTVRLAESGRDALAEVRRSAPDLVLLDYRMEPVNGLEVCRQLKTDPRFEHIPILMLTGEGRIEDRLEGFDAGANDYLAKPFDARELLARVRALLRLTRSGLERNPTSGLPGGEALDREFDRWQGRGHPFAVGYLDLDQFKAFNDRFGFSVADVVIREAGEILREAVRDRDAFVGHVGGDDFLLLSRPEAAVEISAEAQRRLDARIPRYLPADVAAEGWYEGVTRSGTRGRIPVTRLSVAIAYVRPGEWGSLLEVGEALAEAKRRAKEPGAPQITEVQLRR